MFAFAACGTVELRDELSDDGREHRGIAATVGGPFGLVSGLAVLLVGLAEILDTEEVTGSNPVSPTKIDSSDQAFCLGRIFSCTFGGAGRCTVATLAGNRTLEALDGRAAGEWSPWRVSSPTGRMRPPRGG